MNGQAYGPRGPIKTGICIDYFSLLDDYRGYFTIGRLGWVAFIDDYTFMSLSRQGTCFFSQAWTCNYVLVLIPSADVCFVWSLLSGVFVVTDLGLLLIT